LKSLGDPQPTSQTYPLPITEEVFQPKKLKNKGEPKLSLTRSDRGDTLI
jgi:hypothetical protein